MSAAKPRGLGWFLGVVLLIVLAEGVLVRGLFWLADAEGWYDANRWLRNLIIAPFVLVAYHKSGAETFGLRRRLGWKHD